MALDGLYTSLYETQFRGERDPLLDAMPAD